MATHAHAHTRVDAAPEGVVVDPHAAKPPTLTASETQTLADVVKAAPAGSIIVVGNASAASEAKKLLSQAGKECTIAIEEPLGPGSLWRHSHKKA